MDYHYMAMVFSEYVIFRYSFEVLKFLGRSHYKKSFHQDHSTEL